MKKIAGSVLELYAKVIFLLDKYQLKIWFENAVFLFNIVEIEKVLLKCFPPCDQTIPFAYGCSFTLHISYENGMIDQMG